jgi:HPt (histidine-containing phosphotransfer) domain-containing protein
MSYEPAALEAALAAAVGDDPSLVAELRAVLIESANRQADLLERSRCDANWRMAAWKLKGLAASFGAMRLIAAADEAIEAAPGDPVALRMVKRAIEAL